MQPWQQGQWKGRTAGMGISVLAIVPTDGFRSIMREIATKWSDIRLQIIVGNLSEGAEIAGKIGEQYDVIISRGGTADLIRQNCSTPVIEMGISGYDMLRTIMLAQFSGKRSAIVGFPFISSSAEVVKGLFQYQIDIFSVQNEDEVRACLARLKAENYMLVIGDVITCDLAGEFGLDSILIAAGVETIESAFRRATEITMVSRRYRELADLMEHILQDADQVTLAFSAQGELIFSSGDASSKLAILTEWPHKPDLWTMDEEAPRLERFKGTLLRMHKKTVELSSGNYVCFYLRPFPAVPVGAQRGISILTELEPEHIATENYMAHSKTMAPLLALAYRYSKLNFPVALIGERGVGKDTLAYIMSKHSKQRFAATVMIDCILIDEENWIHLLNDPGGVLFQPRVIFYYRNFEMLSPLLKEKIVRHINRMKKQDNSLHIIAINSDSTMSEASCLLPSALNTLQCNMLFIPSLRARQSDIPNLVTLYINQINNQLGTQKASIEAKAIPLLQSFPWPGNLYQFKRVLIELISMKDASVITEEDVRFALQQEVSGVVISNANAMVNMMGTLADIEKRIIHHVLSEENMNHTHTAARLGISRATLWRKIH